MLFWTEAEDLGSVLVGLSNLVSSFLVIRVVSTTGSYLFKSNGVKDKIWMFALFTLSFLL